MATTNKNLPPNEITPVAKPLGAFIQPGQRQTAGAAKPSLLADVPRITTLQRASAGSVQGFNKFEQLSNALGPFTQNLVKTGSQAYLNYAKTNIQQGFENAPEYLAAKNQLAKAKLSLQEQQEKGAKDANAAINFLKNTDPEAAALLEVDNPWRLVGRRKYLAKLLGSEIDNAVENFVANNQSSLASIKPGSGEFEKTFNTILTSLNNQYGLTGDEPEYHSYAVSKINSAKDSFRDKQEKLYNEAVDQSSVETGVASIKNTFNEAFKKGIVVGYGPNFEVVKSGDLGFEFLAAQTITAEIDDTLALLGGDRRTKALSKILNELLPTLQRTDKGKKIVSLIRSGSNNGLKPGTKEWQAHYEKRPFLADSMPFTLLETSNKGAKALNDEYQLQQDETKNNLDQFFYSAAGPFDLNPDSEEGKKAYAETRKKAIEWGYRDVNGYFNEQREEAKSWKQYQTELSEVELNQLKQKIRDYSPEDFEGTGYRSIVREIQTSSSKASTVKELMRILRTREQDLQKRPNISNSVYNQRLGIVFARPELKALIPPKGLGSFATLQIQINQTGDEKARRLESKIDRKVHNIYNKKLNEWYKNNPGRIIPEDDAFNLEQEAWDELEESPWLNKEIEQITKKEKVITPPDPKDVRKESWSKPVGRVGSENVPDRVVKKYRERAVLNGSWLYNELTNLRDKKELSSELKLFAERAKTSPERFLLEQIRFWREPDGSYKFDPDGSVRKYLEGFVNGKKSTDQAALTFLNKAVANAISPGPGDWMLNMVLGGPASAKPVSAATGLTEGTNEQRMQAAYNLAKKLGAKYPEVVAAQFAQESGFGEIPSGTNNFFGLKALPGSKGSLVNTEEDDASGKSTKIKDNFINFGGEDQSFKYVIDKWHKDYKHFTGVESGKNAQEATKLLQQQGYSTDPNYAKHLQTLIKEYFPGG